MYLHVLAVDTDEMLEVLQLFVFEDFSVLEMPEYFARYVLQLHPSGNIPARFFHHI